MAGDNNSTGTFTAAQNTTEQTAAELQAQLGTLREEHQAYRARVRTQAIQGFHDGEWDLSRLNASLEQLGLEPYTPKKMARATAEIAIRLEADTDDEGVARDTMRQLETPAAVQALREAIATVVQEHVTEGPAVTVQDKAQPSVYIGYAGVVLL